MAFDLAILLETEFYETWKSYVIAKKIGNKFKYLPRGNNWVGYCTSLNIIICKIKTHENANEIILGETKAQKHMHQMLTLNVNNA